MSTGSCAVERASPAVQQCVFSKVFHFIPFRHLGDEVFHILLLRHSGPLGDTQGSTCRSFAPCARWLSSVLESPCVLASCGASFDEILATFMLWALGKLLTQEHTGYTGANAMAICCSRCWFLQVPGVGISCFVQVLE